MCSTTDWGSDRCVSVILLTLNCYYAWRILKEVADYITPGKNLKINYHADVEVLVKMSVGMRVF